MPSRNGRDIIKLYTGEHQETFGQHGLGFFLVRQAITRPKFTYIYILYIYILVALSSHFCSKHSPHQRSLQLCIYNLLTTPACSTGEQHIPHTAFKTTPRPSKPPTPPAPSPPTARLGGGAQTPGASRGLQALDEMVCLAVVALA